MLPKIDVPIYEIKLESQKKKIKFRPFTVKEEKLFLMMNETEDEESIFNTTKQVLSNCVLSDIDINSLPSFDIEYLFLNLRARSIGEEVKIRFNCNNTVTNEEGKETKCNGHVDFNINLLEIKPEKKEGHSTKIELTDKLGLVMKYPTADIIQKYSVNPTVDDVIRMIAECVDFIYDKDEIYYAKDSKVEDLVEWIEGLEVAQIENIRTFFDTMPKMTKTLDFKCPKCAYEEQLRLEGIQSFFV